MGKEFYDLFKVEKTIIGMIHLSGGSSQDKVRRAMDELNIYEKEGVDAAIIENYHGVAWDVNMALEESSLFGFNLILGVNILRDSYLSFNYANEHGAEFVQFDSVQTTDLNMKLYEKKRKKYPNISVLGGVGFKYIPQTGNSVGVDLREGKSRCEAIVTTGDGTGIETPLNKLKKYKKLLRNFPLIVGAGLNPENAMEQLSVADGAIVGSYFKHNGDTHFPVERRKVKSLMDVVRDVRGE